MNKVKIFIIFFLIISIFSTSKGVCAIFEPEFVDNFYACRPYVYDTGAKIRQIIGWVNDKCAYREFTSKAVYDCRFGQSEILELTRAMAYDRKNSPPLTVQYITGKTEVYNTGWRSLDVWKKYLNMPETCNIRSTKY